ncbi:hypothetical protein Nepgr_014971 [Nepenthes gracilis]|uniref:Uncharacterized protein n=1 Tax=Nepenthes gracilis TaxID=150966 RepID=A0AAD3SK93_NEPGR|nr:hypothetical protein Nepgr_014971 [Nepenthes gracilis]
MANGGFIYVSDLLTWPTSSSSSSKLESSFGEASSNEEMLVGVRAKVSVGAVTAEEERHSKTSVLGTPRFLEVPLGFESFGPSR